MSYGDDKFDRLLVVQCPTEPNAFAIIRPVKRIADLKASSYDFLSTYGMKLELFDLSHFWYTNVTVGKQLFPLGQTMNSLSLQRIAHCQDRTRSASKDSQFQGYRSNEQQSPQVYQYTVE